MKHNFALNDKRVLFPKHRIEIALAFSNVYSSLRILFIYGDTPISKFVTLKIVAKVMTYNIRSATFDGKYVTFYLILSAPLIRLCIYLYLCLRENVRVMKIDVIIIIIAKVKFAQSHSLRAFRKTRKMPQFCRQVEGVEKPD